MAQNEPFAFLFWKTLKIFLKNNYQKICTIKKNIVPLHSISRLIQEKKFFTIYYGNIHY